MAVVAEEGGTLSVLGEFAPDLTGAGGAALASCRVFASARSVLGGIALGEWAPAFAVNGCGGVYLNRHNKTLPICSLMCILLFCRIKIYNKQLMVSCINCGHDTFDCEPKWLCTDGRPV